MSNGLWPVGTWVAGNRDRAIYHVDKHVGICMCMTKYGDATAKFSTQFVSFYVKIPPMPDKKALADQGYRLTGMADDCSTPCEGRLNVAIDGRTIVDISEARFYNGWRWLVERIDTEEPSETVSEEYQTGYDAGYRACRDEAIRILSAKEKHDYEG